MSEVGLENVVVTVAEDTETINPAQLAEFLFLFRATALGLVGILPQASPTVAQMPTKDELTHYKAALLQLSPPRLDALFDSDAAPGFLSVGTIARNSPMEIQFLGIPILIALAVIFSGGKVELSITAIKAELPPLGVGIKRLREALGLSKTLKAGYGIRGSVIKLNQAEFDELMKSNTGEGGFQRFLAGLQHRVNKTTKQLELSTEDLAKIYRYKSDPGKGGWQTRFKRIFGRHFP